MVRMHIFNIKGACFWNVSNIIIINFFLMPHKVPPTPPNTPIDLTIDSDTEYEQIFETYLNHPDRTLLDVDYTTPTRQAFYPLGAAPARAMPMGQGTTRARRVRVPSLASGYEIDQEDQKDSSDDDCSWCTCGNDQECVRKRLCVEGGYESPGYPIRIWCFSEERSRLEPHASTSQQRRLPVHRRLFDDEIYLQYLEGLRDGEQAPDERNSNSPSIHWADWDWQES